MTVYDVIDGDGRRLNERPLSYQSAELFALDVMIDSSTHANVVPSTDEHPINAILHPRIISAHEVEWLDALKKRSRQKRIPWLVLVGVVAAVILGVVVVGCL